MLKTNVHVTDRRPPIEPSELNDTLPKLKHTFVILFPLVSIYG